MTIMLFGAIGTLISFSIISFGAIHLFKMLGIGFLETRDCLAIGAIFSATDSVCTLQVLNQEDTPLLYSLVFGEGVVNDAASVVLFNAIQKFDLSHINSGTALHFVENFLILFITSTLLGVLVGLLSAYITKKLHLGRHSPDREVALMILMAYLSYMTAELFDLSGILTVFFCGIVMSHYTWHSMTDGSKVTTKHSFATLSFISEICIFLYVGMDALDIEKWKFVQDSPGKSVGLSVILLCLVLIGRASFVFPLSFLSNFAKKSKSEKIEFKQQVIIWWAGLMRGAVSMALAYNQVFGSMTKWLVRLLIPPSSLPSHISEPSSPKSSTLPLLDSSQDPESDTGDNNVHRPPSLRMLLSTPTHTVHRYWRKFDDTYMRPLFGGRGFVPHVPASPTENGIH